MSSVLASFILFLLTPSQDPARERIERLLLELDSDTPEDREAAERELLDSGELFEPLLRKAAVDGRPEVRARCRDLLQQISLLRKHRESWAPAKPISLSLKATPLREALERISRSTGYPVRPADAISQTPVTLAIEGASFFQSLEAVCLSAGAWYRWNGGTLEVLKTEPPHSRGHAGPVLLTAELGHSQNGAEAAIRFQLEWEPGVHLRWYEIDIDSAEDDQGGAVSIALPQNQAGFAHRLVYFRSRTLPADGEPRFRAEDRVDVTSLRRNATRLKNIRGRITFFMPEETRRIRFEKKAREESIDVDSITATLRDFAWGHGGSDGWNASLDLDLRRTAVSKHSALFAFLLNSKIRFIDADGRPHETENGGASSSGQLDDPLQRVGTSVHAEKLPESPAPKAVEAMLVTDVWEKTYPFELKDVAPAGLAK